jgi:hypothetical protein
MLAPGRRSPEGRVSSLAAMVRGPDRPAPAARRLMLAIFLIITIVALWVPFYNRAEPALFGVPFFYWFQVAWILPSVAATVLAYRLKI